MMFRAAQDPHLDIPVSPAYNPRKARGGMAQAQRPLPLRVERSPHAGPSIDYGLRALRPHRGAALRPGAPPLQCLAIQHPAEIFDRMSRGGEFDIAEMGCSLHLSSHGGSDYPFVAVPVFPSKLFRHGFISINTGAGTRGPEHGGRDPGPERFRGKEGRGACLWPGGLRPSGGGVDQGHPSE